MIGFLSLGSENTGTCIRVGKSYIPLVEDIHINSVVHLTSQNLLKPQSVTCVMAKTY